MRTILDADGDIICRVSEENPDSAFRALTCELSKEVRRVYDYPEAWLDLSDRELYALCRAGELVEDGD